FANELWFAVIPPLSNAPSWSIGFEFWYYVIFGATYFLNGYIRILAVFILCMVAGPKILLLMPVWFFGVAAYWISRSFQARPVLGLMLMASAAAILIVAAKLAIKQQLYVLEHDLLGEHVFYLIGHAQGFIWHTVLGAVV